MPLPSHAQKLASERPIKDNNSLPKHSSCTSRYLDETTESRILHKGTFGTMVPGGLRNNLFRPIPRNIANTGILPLGDRCLALFEAGQPHALDPDSLATLGVDVLGGAVCPGAPFSTGWDWLDRFAGKFLLGWRRQGGGSNGLELAGQSLLGWRRWGRGGKGGGVYPVCQGEALDRPTSGRFPYMWFRAYDHKTIDMVHIDCSIPSR